MKTYQLIIKLLRLVFVFFIIYIVFFIDFDWKNLKKNKFIISKTDRIIIKKKIPEEYFELFNIDDRKKIKNYLTREVKNISYDESVIFFDSLHIDLYKYKISNNNNNFLENIKILKRKPKPTRFVAYSSGSTNNLEIKNILIKQIDTIEIISETQLDTLISNHNIIIFKGNLKTLSIVLQKEMYNTIFIKDKRIFPYFRKGVPFYLILKRKEQFLYVMFVEASNFNDKKILNIFGK